MKCIIYVEDDFVLSKKGTDLDVEVARALYPFMDTVSEWDPDSVRVVPNGDKEIDEDEGYVIVDKVLSPGGSLYWDAKECPAVGQRFHAIVCYVNLE